MILILVPLAVWTLAAMLLMWPKDLGNHIVPENARHTASGTDLVSAEITQVTQNSCTGVQGTAPGTNSVCAEISVKLLEGPDKDKEVSGLQLSAAVYSSGVRVGQKVVVWRTPISETESAYQFQDFKRDFPVWFFIILFAISVVIVARWRGFMALLGLIFAFFIILKFMMPALITGQNPVLVGLVGGSAIMFVVLYAAHGFTARTTTALVGTLFGLILSAILGAFATWWAHLTGVAAEDDYILASAAPDLHLTSVVICGIIIAGCGVLNDVTITQASAVWELSETGLKGRELYKSAMRIGRDHIASTVYTIAFASAGAILGVLLLLSLYQRPLLETMMTEQFAAEIIRTLVGAIGLVLAVPLTTWIAVFMIAAGSKTETDAIQPSGAVVRGDALVDDEESDEEEEVLPSASHAARRSADEADSGSDSYRGFQKPKRGA